MEDSNKIGEYSIIAKIGEGAFGQIYEVEREGKIYAIKTVPVMSSRKPLATSNPW
jgi:serine/threonine protein kinase